MDRSMEASSPSLEESTIWFKKMTAQYLQHGNLSFRFQTRGENGERGKQRRDTHCARSDTLAR